MINQAFPGTKIRLTSDFPKPSAGVMFWPMKPNEAAVGIVTVLAMIIVGIISLGVYFLPTILGLKKRNALSIFVLNFFLGWTLIGWVAALVWACTVESVPPPIQRG